MTGADNYFMQQDEPYRGCLLALRSIILSHDEGITESLKYGMPFYTYNGRMFCYLWTHKKYRQPYLGIVEGKWVDHPLLLQEKRARMKILLTDPEQDIPADLINSMLEQLLRLLQ